VGGRWLGGGCGALRGIALAWLRRHRIEVREYFGGDALKEQTTLGHVIAEVAFHHAGVDEGFEETGFNVERTFLGGLHEWDEFFEKLGFSRCWLFWRGSTRQKSSASRKYFPSPQESFL
jgi:hypothetical protein